MGLRPIQVDEEWRDGTSTKGQLACPLLYSRGSVSQIGLVSAPNPDRQGGDPVTGH